MVFVFVHYFQIICSRRSLFFIRFAHVIRSLSLTVILWSLAPLARRSLGGGKLRLLL